MKPLLENINRAFDHRIRLAMMSVLTVSESTDFNTSKGLLEVTDSNLASYTRVLETEKYIVIEKSFIGWKTNTSYKAAKKKREAFQEHLNTLEKSASLSISR